MAVALNANISTENSKDINAKYQASRIVMLILLLSDLLVGLYRTTSLNV